MEDLLEILNHDIPILAGTRLQGTPKAPFVASVIRGYLHFCWGYVRGGNSHSGVSILIKLSRFSRASVSQVYSPEDPEVRGRFGAIRIRLRNRYDLIISAMYLPPFGSGKNSTKIKDLVLKFASKIH